MARATAIARQCLEGDPFREVPDLDVAATALFDDYHGGEPMTGTEIDAVRARRGPAFAVAGSALASGRMAADRVPHD